MYAQDITGGRQQADSGCLETFKSFDERGSSEGGT